MNWFDFDTSDIERRIFDAYTQPPDYIDMVKHKGVWQMKKEKRYAESVDWAFGYDWSVRTDMLYGAGLLGKSPSFIIMDECGPGQAAFDAAEKTYGTRTGRFTKSAVRPVTHNEPTIRVVDSDDEFESRRRAIRTALVRIPVAEKLV